MTEPLIRLLETEAPIPQPAYIPYKFSRRWWSDVENGSERTSSLPVFLTQKAYAKICAHANSDMDNEVGGWLIGKWCADRVTGEKFIVVEAPLPAVHTRQGSAFLTFTQDSQVAMYDLMEDRYPGKELVGWYHTHPRMSVFLSGYDVWLHNHFFPNPWQIALVIEPHTNAAGLFIRDTENHLDARHYFGFYEISSGEKPSVVAWENMHQAQQESPGEEG